VGLPWGAAFGALAGAGLAYWAAGNLKARVDGDAEKMFHDMLASTDLRSLSAGELMQLRAQIISA
jgi:hypothetical protein